LSIFTGRAAPVEGHDGALVLDPDPDPAQVGGVGLTSEVVDPAGPILERRIDLSLSPAGTQQLRPVRAEVGDRPDRDHRAGVGRLATTDAGHHLVAARDPDQQLTGRLGHLGGGGVLDDRRQRPVDVEQDR
jgi:hypothetical protein